MDDPFLLNPVAEAVRCFACGPENATGLRLRFEVREGRVETRWTATAPLEGWGGLLHGGVIATLHDEAAAWAMIGLTGRTGVTTRSEIRFFKPVRTGDAVTVRGRVEQLDEAHGRAATRIQLSNGAVASTAVTEYRFLDADGFERVLGRPLSPAMRAWLAAEPEQRIERLRAPSS